MPHSHEHSEPAFSKRGILAKELKAHVPFTALGALSGIAVMAIVVATRASHTTSDVFLHVLHPAHILLSAIVSTAMYWRYRRNWIVAAVIGYVGSVVICSLSDIVLPYLGGMALGAHMHFHLCFVEHWWLVNPLALLGVGIAFWWPHTKLPHSGHVLLSTWASLFYLTAHSHGAHGHDIHWLPLLPAVFVILFIAVWVPCCVSDIVFPLLFVGPEAAAEHVHEH